MGGDESPFGREFDSLADIVSFGAAPAFLVHRIVLADVFVDHPQIGWFIASVYLICGAFRLARFNCLAAMNSGGSSKEFLGFPIPAAAGLVASLTLFLLWIEEKGFSQSKLRLCCCRCCCCFLSAMMVSEVKYPSFKSLDFRAKRSFSQDAHHRAVRRLFPDSLGKRSARARAADFHGLSALRFCAAVHLARVAARN